MLVGSATGLDRCLRRRRQQAEGRLPPWRGLERPHRHTFLGLEPVTWAWDTQNRWAASGVVASLFPVPCWSHRDILATWPAPQVEPFRGSHLDHCDPLLSLYQEPVLTGEYKRPTHHWPAAQRGTAPTRVPQGACCVSASKCWH